MKRVENRTEAEQDAEILQRGGTYQKLNGEPSPPMTAQELVAGLQARRAALAEVLGKVA